MSFKLEKTRFIGIKFIDKNGKEELVKPCEEVKKQIEEYLDERNGIISHINKLK